MPLSLPGPGSLASGDPGALGHLPSIFALTDSATRIRPTEADDGALGQAVVNVETGPYPCFVSPRKGSDFERTEAGSEKSITLWNLYFEAGTDIQPPDRIRVNGSTFDVTGTDASASNAVLLSVQAYRIL